MSLKSDVFINMNGMYEINGENETTKIAEIMKSLSTLENSSESSYWISTISKENPEMNYGTLLLIPIIVLIALGNIMVIMLVGVDRRLQSATNYFLSSLAVADMLVAITVMPLSLAMIVNNYKWPFSDTICGLWIMLDVFFSTASILHLCMISFDRYTALSLPFKLKRSTKKSMRGNVRSGQQVFLDQRGKKKCKHVAKRVAIVWSIAFGVALPIPILGKFERNNLFVKGMCTVNMPKFQILGSLVAFFLPLTIMFIMYTLTIRTLNHQAQMVSKIIVHSGRNSPRRSSSITQTSTVREDIYTMRQFERQKAKDTIRPEYDAYVAKENIDVYQNAYNRCNVCSKSLVINGRNEQGSWRKTLMPIYQTLRRLCSAIFYSCQKKENMARKYMERKTSEEDRCTCIDKRDKNKDIIGYNDSDFEPSFRRQSRKLRHSQRRVSSSFKNRAMASINNEQRASKVLGLIFVLFCVFWCPFFITNTISGLCSSCDEELLGNLLSWFVWVGYVSSGVNPCVYTMFSRRFRETFLLLMKGRISEIRRNSNRLSSFSSTSTRNSRASSIVSLKSSVFPVPQAKDNETASANFRKDSESNWMKNVESATSFKTNSFTQQSISKKQLIKRKDEDETRSELWRWPTREKSNMQKILEELHEKENLVNVEIELKQATLE